jgi:hypothetical protein
MLAYAHIPTGTAANNGFEIDQVKGRAVASAIALTAIGAGLRNRLGCTFIRGSGCLTIEVHLKMKSYPRCEAMVPA